MKLCVAALMAGVSTNAMSAQQASVIPHVSPGAQLRIASPTVRGLWLNGSLHEANSGFVATNIARGEIVIPWSRIASLSVSTGRDAGVSIARGILSGMAASLIAYPALTARSTDSRALAQVVSFGVLPVAGGLIGHRIAPQRWEEVRWRPTMDSVMNSEDAKLRLPQGTRVNARTGRRVTVTGELIEAGDSLKLRSGGDVRQLSWESVSELRVRQGRNRIRGAALGLSASTIVSAIMLGTSSVETTEDRQLLMIRNFGIGTAIGALVGVPAWTRVPVLVP